MSPLKRPKLDRLTVNLQVEVRGAARLFIASARDLSPGGLRLRGNIRLAEEERLGLTFLLPPEMKFSVPAEVRWTRDEGDLGFGAGIEFLHTVESPQRIRQLLCDIQNGTIHNVFRGGGTTRLPRNR